mgnify:CR=1 FL=1
MTLKTIIEKLKEYALATPNVGGVIVNDVFRENFWENAHYGVVAIIQREHSISDNLATYRFQLAYIDRLTEDKSNEVDVQSDGIMTLSNVINALAELNEGIELADEMSFSVFNERFKDECGGVLADVALVTASPMGICHDVAFIKAIPSAITIGADGRGVDIAIISNVKWKIANE